MLNLIKYLILYIIISILNNITSANFYDADIQKSGRVPVAVQLEYQVEGLNVGCEIASSIEIKPNSYHYSTSDKSYYIAQSLDGSLSGTIQKSIELRSPVSNPLSLDMPHSINIELKDKHQNCSTINNSNTKIFITVYTKEDTSVYFNTSGNGIIEQNTWRKRNKIKIDYSQFINGKFDLGLFLRKEHTKGALSGKISPVFGTGVVSNISLGFLKTVNLLEILLYVLKNGILQKVFT